MPIAFTTTAPNQTIEVPAGIHPGHIHVAHSGCRFVRVGPGRAVIRAVGDVSSLIRTTGDVYGTSVKGIDFDAAGLAAVGVPLEVGPGLVDLDAEDVAVLGTHRGATAIDNRGWFTGRRLLINGDGGGIRHAAEARATIVSKVRIHGGRYGFVNVTGGPVGSQRNINVTSLLAELYYWAIPSCEEAVPLAVGANWIDVASHVATDRSLYDVLRVLTPLGTVDLDRTIPTFRGARRWDRVETASRQWSQILAVAADGTLTFDHWHAPGSWRTVARPAGRVTIYRPSLGCFFGAASGLPNRLNIWTAGAEGGHWRGVAGGSTMPVIRPGSRLDIIRWIEGNRDMDTGGILCGETALAPVFTDCTIVGAGSDGITVRGVDAVLASCRALLGQDMGYTLGAVRAVGCMAAQSGRHGYSLHGQSDLAGCRSLANGLHADGAAGIGVFVDTDAIDSFLDVTCADNFIGGFAGSRSTPDLPVESW